MINVLVIIYDLGFIYNTVLRSYLFLSDTVKKSHETYSSLSFQVPVWTLARPFTSESG